MRVMRLSACFLFALASAVAAYPINDNTIGHVKDLEGKWCRGGVELKKEDKLRLQDDVRYCDSPLVKEHYLEIEFHRQTPLSHKYSCSIPGTCSPPQSLYLTGYFYFGEPASPTPPSFIGVPRTTSFRIRDYVIDQTGQLPANVQGLLYGKKAMMCRIDFPEFNAKSFFAQQPTVNQCVTGKLSAQQLTRGSLYGIYFLKDKVAIGMTQSPSGLVLYSYPQSKSLSDWNKITGSIRWNDDQVSVWDRRSIILNLLNNEMLFAPNAPQNPEEKPKIPGTSTPSAKPASEPPASPPPAALTPKL